MKKIMMFAGVLCLMAGLAGCGQDAENTAAETVKINLSDESITVNGQDISRQAVSGVELSDDIVYYRRDMGEDYGEGTADDEHSRRQARRHKVITITQPGDYTVSGSLSRGQIAIDLGRDSAGDSRAAVNLTLDNVELTCTVAPAIICYNAYECSSYDLSSASKDVDTSAAGFNLILADGSTNRISGSHVAKIYKEGTTEKLHKYDAAIESLVSMNISGPGRLELEADNEGIESALHMTVNGGVISITSGDDRLNAGEDGVSVITINDGTILANSGAGDEGDGIDSNGWIVINGGYVSAFANSSSMDSGVDSDNGVYINGGTLFAAGNMYDEISSSSGQNFIVMNFGEKITAGQTILIKSSSGDPITALRRRQDYTVMVYSSPLFEEDDYTVYLAEDVRGEETNGIYVNITSYTERRQLAYSGSRGAGTVSAGGRPSMTPPDGGQMPDEGERPENGERPEKPDGEKPRDMPRGEAPEGAGPGGGRPDDADITAGRTSSGTQRENTLFSFGPDSCFFTNVKRYNS